MPRENYGKLSQTASKVCWLHASILRLPSHQSSLPLSFGAELGEKGRVTRSMIGYAFTIFARNCLAKSSVVFTRRPIFDRFGRSLILSDSAFAASAFAALPFPPLRAKKYGIPHTAKIVDSKLMTAP